MTSGERVRYIRKYFDLTLDKFGERLGVGKTAISKIEKGENRLSEQMAIAICRTYHINYEWLKNEVGEMFADTSAALNPLTQGERVKAIRKSLGITLAQFGDKVGLKKSALSLIETGKNKLTEQTTLAICNTYQVNYKWLINGEGDIFVAPVSDLDNLCAKYNLDDMDRVLLDMYINLPPASRNLLKNSLHNSILAIMLSGNVDVTELAKMFQKAD